MALSEAEKKKLWDKYMKTKSQEIREQLILEYVNLVNPWRDVWVCILVIQLSTMIW